MVRSLSLLAGLLLVTASRDLPAHPLHTSYAEIVRDRSGRLMISIKIFSDDFQSALARSARNERLQPNGGEDVRRYLQRVFQVRTPDGGPVALSWCGFRTEGNQIIICATTSLAVRGAILVSNSLLFERFADQINIMRWTTPSGTRTVVLTRHSREVALH
jgi:hypothetical protein